MKYVSILWNLTKGHRLSYFFAFFILFFALLFMQLSTFMTKVLVDTLLDSPPTGPIDTFLTYILGGQPFLKNNLWVFSLMIFGLGLARAFIFYGRLIIRGTIETNIAKTIQLDIFYHIDRKSVV
jgi:ABC-type multidrug transport system fused ATPase/permease subunit